MHYRHLARGRTGLCRPSPTALRQVGSAPSLSVQTAQFIDDDPAFSVRAEVLPDCFKHTHGSIHDNRFGKLLRLPHSSVPEGAAVALCLASAANVFQLGARHETPPRRFQPPARRRPRCALALSVKNMPRLPNAWIRGPTQRRRTFSPINLPPPLSQPSSAVAAAREFTCGRPEFVASGDQDPISLLLAAVLAAPNGDRACFGPRWIFPCPNSSVGCDH